MELTGVLACENVSPWTLATAALLVAVSVTCAIWAWQSTYWERRGVPSLPVEPFFGNTRDRTLLRVFGGEVYARLYKELHPYPFGGVFEGTCPILIVRDPDLVKKIMVKDFAHFEDRGFYLNEKFNPLLGNLFCLTGSRWRNLRLKLTPAFTSGKMKMMFGLMHDCALELRSLLEEPGSRGEVVEMKDVVAKFTTDVIGTCAFGLQFNSMRDPDSEFRRMGKAVFEPSLLIGIRQVVVPFFPSFGNIIRFPPKHISDFFLRVVKETVEYREKNNVKRNDFLQLLIELRNKAQLLDDYENSDTSSVQNGSAKNVHQDSGSPKDSEDIELTDSLLTAQVFSFFSAGYETSATTMGFALHELAMNPEMQNKVQTEIDTVLHEHNGVFSYESIQRMNYLDKVIQETMRKYPPIPTHYRRCTIPYTIPGTGVKIERGTYVFISVLGLQKDPKYFPDPEKFDPERFSEENKAKRSRFVYLPFGEGPRICIAMRFGQLQTKLGLAMLLHSYRFTPCEKTQRQVMFEPKAFLTVAKGGNWLRVTSRR